MRSVAQAQAVFIALPHTNDRARLIQLEAQRLVGLPALLEPEGMRTVGRLKHGRRFIQPIQADDLQLPRADYDFGAPIHSHNCRHSAPIPVGHPLPLPAISPARAAAA